MPNSIRVYLNGVTAETSPLRKAYSSTSSAFGRTVHYCFFIVRYILLDITFKCRRAADELFVTQTAVTTTDQWRDNYILIGLDREFDDEQRRFIGELEDNYRIRAQIIDTARTLLLREHCSAYILERLALPMIQQGIIKKCPMRLPSNHRLMLSILQIQLAPTYKKLH